MPSRHSARFGRDDAQDEDALMNANIAALLYLVSGALFILALRGLASPETARIGNPRGMIGMGLAILTTLAVTAVSDALTVILLLGCLGIGGALRAVAAA